jgi:FtsK/SpoIIIE family
MMARRRAVRVMYTDRPFQRLFPKLSLFVAVVAAIVRLLAALFRLVWPFRRELAAFFVLCGGWWLVGRVVPGWWSLVATLVIGGALLRVERISTPVRAWLRGGRVRRQLRAGLKQTRSANLDGKLPWVVKVRPTPIGDRLWLWLRPGQSLEGLDPRAAELRVAVGSRDVRLSRDERRSDRIVVDVIRHDTLAAGWPVAWADRDADVLSMWDPIHWGMSELGEPVRLSLVERAVLIGGNRGAGKSNGLNLIVAHAAKSPDVELLLIDANRVQLAPWADRALAFAGHEIDDAIDVVALWRKEVDRRLALFTTLPGLPVALTREMAAQYGMPMWLLVIDELAYHTSVAGTPAQQKEFYALLRDGVARGRAAGIGAVVATQRPTHDLIPTSLRDLFDIRIAYRTMTRTSSDVILGDDFARRGFCATDIDIRARGVAWLLAEGTVPIRTKTAWIPPELRVELSVTTVRFRPTPRGEWPPAGQELA